MKRRTLPKTLSKADQDRLMTTLSPAHGKRELRRLAITKLMLDLGLRGVEVRNLKVADIDWKTGKMLVNGKGRRQRVLWLSTAHLDLLRRWREARDTLPQANGHLFTCLDGRPLEERNLRRLVKTGLRRADLPGDPHPHALRHTFATDLLRATRNLRLVQKALGHASVATTEIYTHVVDEELETALKHLREA